MGFIAIAEMDLDSFAASVMSIKQEALDMACDVVVPGMAERPPLGPKFRLRHTLGGGITCASVCCCATDSSRFGDGSGYSRAGEGMSQFLIDSREGDHWNSRQSERVTEEGGGGQWQTVEISLGTV